MADEISILRRSFNAAAPLKLSGRKRASVALLLRRGKAGLEMLFIKRATREGDRWSGDVALPGGKQEADENEFQAVVREVEEELGLTLSDSGTWECLGQIDDRRALELTVRCFAFLQIVEETPSLRLQAAEVAACGWCPVQHLCRPTSEVQVRGRLPISRFDKSKATRVLSMLMLPRILNLDTLCFSTIVLPMHDVQPSQFEFNLWGLTLGMVNDFLVQSGLRPSSDPFKIIPHLDFIGLRLEGCLCPGILQNVASKAVLKVARSCGDPHLSPVKAPFILLYAEVSMIMAAIITLAFTGARRSLRKS